MLEKVMTVKEASKRWGMPVTTIKQACSGQRNTPPRFTPEEWNKPGGTWLVTYSGMRRLYGEPKEEYSMIKHGVMWKDVKNEYQNALAVGAGFEEFGEGKITFDIQGTKYSVVGQLVTHED